MLRRVVRIRRRVVAPEDVAGRSVMVERQGKLGAGRTLTILISRLVPPERRGDVVAEMLRSLIRHSVANDSEATPESRVFTASTAGL